MTSYQGVEFVGAVVGFECGDEDDEKQPDEDGADGDCSARMFLVNVDLLKAADEGLVVPQTRGTTLAER